MIEWNATPVESQIIRSIVKRAVSLAESSGLCVNTMQLHMDIEACHCNGCPLDLQKLADSTNQDFSHDVWGIQRHINRETGKLDNGFVPRYAEYQLPTQLKVGPL